MKQVNYTCDECNKVIDGQTRPDEKYAVTMAGGGELCTLSYEGIVGHNQVPYEGWHYHYYCFTRVVDRIVKEGK